MSCGSRVCGILLTVRLMDARRILETLAAFFDRERIEYAVIGAFALYGYGYVRATRDIDFLTGAQHQAKVVAFLESLGFETTHRSEVFTNHVHPVGAVRVDVMYVDGGTAGEVLSARREAVILKGTRLPVVSPEHLIALKLFAAHNDPRRRFRELGDIREVMARAGVDMETVRRYFVKYGQEEFFEDYARPEG
jgi:hypothetical protein